jgi:hypothetical protein
MAECWYTYHCTTAGQDNLIAKQSQSLFINHHNQGLSASKLQLSQQIMALPDRALVAKP